MEKRNNRAMLRAVTCNSLFSDSSVLSVLSILSLLPLPAIAQTRATGRVINADSTPVPGARVVLHRVGRDAQGPLDSTRADQQGMARFVFRPDSGAFYLLSAEYAGVEYFSPPLPTNTARPDTVVQIPVYDTSSTAPVSLEARHMVVTRPAEDGSRGVLDLLVLHNQGRLTRVAPDSLHPSWSGFLPQGTVGLEVAESDFSREALARRGDSLLLLAPFAPGEKQITVQYLIPANRRAVDLPLGSPGAKINVLAEESGVRVSGSGLAKADSQVLQGRTFHRWTGAAQDGGVLTIALPGSGRTPPWLLVVPVALLTLVLLGAGWRLLSRPGLMVGRTPELIDAMAALDFRYAGRESETPGEEWSEYLAERARLKARLEASLAAGPARR